MGAVGSVTITPGAAWDWKSASVRKFWNYDSMFIWISACSGDVSWGVENAAPYDYLTSSDGGITWSVGNWRVFIRAGYRLMTVGDLPISGTVNNVPIPAGTSQRDASGVTLTDGVENTMLTVNGAGYSQFIDAKVAAHASSHNVTVRIYCDGVLAYSVAFIVASDKGFTASTPGVSLTAYTADGVCELLFTTKFEFRRSLVVTMQPSVAGIIATATTIANLIG
jgi:hypothetical protein